ncbi:hypothetical protein [Streptomyces sp. 142MFCol3.1]|uniref:hypothetical protein n=1 Tax=Streptomyces sp. 142MFCol3.1 TaxID=1172179 RepID=UPI001319D14B|nr:hypothetical protein [Streptomyces sp. 142MFCol3.1]
MRSSSRRPGRRGPASQRRPRCRRRTSAAASPRYSQDKRPDTELAVGDTFAYEDGLRAKVTGINKITQFGEYGDRPEAGKTAFRVKFQVSNNTAKPYDLDSLSCSAEGCTTGGETGFITVEPGSKQDAGRLATGRTGAFTSEYSITMSDGTTIVFTVIRK